MRLKEIRRIKEEEMVRKYVSDSEGLIAEMKEINYQPQMKVGEQFVVFIFGRIFKYLKFRDISIGHLKDLNHTLDALAWLGEQVDEILVEFESSSSKFKPHIAKGDVKPEDYSRTLIVCWDDNARTLPKEIDILALEPLWKKANPNV